MRLKGRNSRSRLEAWDWQAEILDLVSKHETERKKFSISSRELKNGSRYALVGRRMIEEEEYQSINSNTDIDININTNTDINININ